MNTIPNYYRPSGRFSPLSFVFFVIVALTLLPLLGLLYAYGIWYIPLIYVNFLLTAGFGFGVGLALSMIVVNIGKVRNPILALGFGLLGGLVALYLHWAVWVDLVINAGESYGSDTVGITVSNIEIFQVFSLAVNPGILFELIGQINEVGTWGLRGATVSGVFLSIVWAIEAVVVLGFSAYLPFVAAKKPFSEEKNQWMDERQLPAFNFIYHKDQMISALEQASTDIFNELTRVEDPTASHSIFTLYPSDTGHSYLTIENKMLRADKEGKAEFDSDEFVRYITVNPEQIKALLAK